MVHRVKQFYKIVVNTTCGTQFSGIVRGAKARDAVIKRFKDSGADVFKDEIIVSKVNVPNKYQKNFK